MQGYIEFVSPFLPMMLSISLLLATLDTVCYITKNKRGEKEDENEMERNARKW